MYKYYTKHSIYMKIQKLITHYLQITIKKTGMHLLLMHPCINEIIYDLLLYNSQ